MPDFDSLFPEQGDDKSFDALFPADIEKERQAGIQHGPFADLVFGDADHNPAARILNAFGQGVKQGWGSDRIGMSDETADYLKKAGVFNDYDKGQKSIIKAANDALMRQAAVALNINLRSQPALLGGVAKAVGAVSPWAGEKLETGIEIAQDPALQASLSGMGAPGAFMAGAERTLAMGLPRQLAEARSLGVIGEGEAGWKGTAPQAEATDAAHAEAVKQTVETTEPQPVGAAPAAAAEAAPQEAAPALPTVPSPKIVADVSQKLIAAGRPAEEAEASAQLVSAYWQTRAERFKGAKGTAEDMYAAEGPEIKAGKVQDRVLAQRPNEQDLFQITAFHGSPYDFDRFDISKVGTGEGAQVYGHGLYFAENPKTAGAYRDQLSGNNIDSKNYYQANGDLVKDIGKEFHGAAQAAQEAGVHPDAARAIVRQLDDHIQFAGSNTAESFLKKYDVDPQYKAAYEAAAQKLSGIKYTLNHGRVYEVNIDAEPVHFLDFDKPLNEQSKFVKSALSKMPGGEYTVQSKLTPKSILPETPEGAAYLRQHGIPGIKYLDQGSRSSNGKVRLQTEFRDGIIDDSSNIVERFFAARFKENDGDLGRTVRQLEDDAGDHPKDSTVRRTLYFARLDRRQQVYFHAAIGGHAQLRAVR